MGQSTTTTYHCDKCGKKLPGSHNALDIMTSLSESSCWSRLHIRIFRIHGMHNDSTTDRAELCKTCTLKLLGDAMARIRKGERATAGVEESDQARWGGKL